MVLVADLSEAAKFSFGLSFNSTHPLAFYRSADHPCRSLSIGLKMGTFWIRGEKCDSTLASPTTISDFTNNLTAIQG